MPRSQEPKGPTQPSPGQSEAPPWVFDAKLNEALKGRNSSFHETLLRPYRAWIKNERHDPGRRFALPWARLFEPFRLQKGEGKIVDNIGNGIREQAAFS